VGRDYKRDWPSIECLPGGTVAFRPGFLETLQVRGGEAAPGAALRAALLLRTTRAAQRRGQVPQAEAGTG